MKKHLNAMLASARDYNLWDYSVFKTCLFSMGVLVGSAFPKKYQKYHQLLAGIFMVSYVMIMTKTLIGYLHYIKKETY